MREYVLHRPCDFCGKTPAYFPNESLKSSDNKKSDPKDPLLKALAILSEISNQGTGRKLTRSDCTED